MLLLLLAACAPPQAPMSPASSAREAPAQTLQVGGGVAVAQRAGDVDGDGYDDLWIGPYQGTLSLHRGGPQGLDPAPWMTTAEAAEAWSAGDADGDGVRDLVGVAQGSLTTWRVTAAGTVTKVDTVGQRAAGPLWEISTPGGRSVWGFTFVTESIGWFGDTSIRLDLAWLGHDPALRGRTTLVQEITRPTELSVGDCNGDGWGDLQDRTDNETCVNPLSGVFLGGPGGVVPGVNRFTPTPGVEASPCSDGLSSRVGDVDADGVDDAIMLDEGHWFRAGLNVPRQPFARGWELSFTSSYQRCGRTMPLSQPAGDLNGDGFGDVALTKGAMLHLHGGGPNGLPNEPARFLEVPGCIYQSVAAGDLNGDGFEDLAVTTDGAVALLLGGPMDTDGDGVHTPADCDDHDTTRHPGAPERPDDGVDQDCDGADGCLIDTDGDGYTGTNVPLPAGAASCAAAGLPATALDCDEGRTDIHPGAVDIPNDDVDDDCDGLWTCLADGDHDRWGARTPFLTPCSVNEYLVTTDGDCDGAKSGVYPGAPERVGDILDQDCDGWLACFVDVDGDGTGSARRRQAVPMGQTCNQPGLSDREGDCSERRTDLPTPFELADDGLDNDCDGRMLCYVDLDRDGAAGTPMQLPVPASEGSCAELPNAGYPGGVGATIAADCDDNDPLVQGGVEILGDAVDQDCDGSTGVLLRAERRRVGVVHSTEWFTASGVPSGATVHFIFSTAGPGAGPCPALLGGACLGVRQPVRVITRTAAGREATTGELFVRGAPQVWVEAWVEDRGIWYGSRVVAGFLN